MHLEMRFERNGDVRRIWYGRFIINGKKECVNLGVKMTGNPPKSFKLKDQGDAEFELSKGMAYERLKQVAAEAQRRRNANRLLERMYEMKTGVEVRTTLLSPSSSIRTTMPPRRGLILHGALPADDSVQPFPVNRPRSWEQKVLLAHEKPKPKGWAASKASPVARIGGLVALGAVLLSALIFGFIIPGFNQVARAPTRTPGPSPTYTLTPTSVNATGQPAAAIGTRAPVSELVAVPYTPTPLYVSLAGSPLTQDLYRSAKLSYTKRDWDGVIRTGQDILKLEANSPTAYYLMGDAYRFKGDFSSAINAYQSAISLTPEFGPAYVGLARARLGLDPNTDVRSFLDEAIRLDPNFGEPYLERAKARIRQNDISGALSDLADHFTMGHCEF